MIGKTISHYRIISKLGEGGMGVVFQAEDMNLRRTVALKFMSEGALGSTLTRERFIREAQAAGSLEHPNICAVHGIEEANDQVFIVMSYVPGTNLQAKIGSPQLTLRRAVDLAVQICEGLQEAHENGIVHRDVKAANVIVTPKWQAKITDFGLALIAERSRLTKVGSTVNSWHGRLHGA